MKSPKSRHQGFSYYFCLMIEGSGAGYEAGSIPLNNGSGFRRLKNIRIRICNTAKLPLKFLTKYLIFFTLILQK
jgi:hypothetical protein